MTDDQVATLRAQLAGRPAKHHRQVRRPDPSEAGAGYSALISAAFFEAARRRFVRNGWPAEDGEVADFVASARGRSKRAIDVIVPGVAERVINHAIGKLPLEANDDIDPNVATRVKTLLLAALVGDEQFSDAKLDRFMTRARELADESLR
ncbi:hypothetical protein [Actinomadura macra]|uniref:hypothetical protein n=1 Tax=Actinomadura macra TaxID=46164 RepID=UPI0012F8DB9C|nr:hypothetical protein [Actinomadura macra]